MTDVDSLPFRQLVRRVAAGRGRPASDDQLDGLWLLVNDLAFDVFERAFLAAAKETRYFPSAAEIRAYAQKQASDRAVRPDVLAAVSQGEQHCLLCQDTGWAPCTRDAGYVYGPGATVPAVRVCACRLTNPVYQTNRLTTRRLGNTENV